MPCPEPSCGSPFPKGLCLLRPPHLPQGPAPSTISVPKWLFLGRWPPPPPVKSPPCLSTKGCASWGQCQRCSGHSPSVGTAPLSAAPHWSAPQERALAWEPLGGFPATHLAPYLSTGHLKRCFCASSPRCLDRITGALCDCRGRVSGQELGWRREGRPGFCRHRSHIATVGLGVGKGPSCMSTRLLIIVHTCHGQQAWGAGHCHTHMQPACPPGPGPQEGPFSPLGIHTVVALFHCS